MAALAGIATLAFILAGGTVGFRLIRLALKSGEAPERLIGWGLFLIAGIAYPVSIVMRAEAAPDAVRGLAFATAMGALALGSTALAEFVRQVFRPETGWSKGLVWAIAAIWAALFAVSAFVAVTEPPENYFSTGLRFFVRQGLMVVVFTWCSLDAFHYWWKLRLRARFGIGDPEVRNRVALWCVAGAASLCSSGAMTVVGLTGVNPLSDPIASFVIGVSGLVSSGALVLAFMPPKPYLAWVCGTPAAGEAA